MSAPTVAMFFSIPALTRRGQNEPSQPDGRAAEARENPPPAPIAARHDEADQSFPATIDFAAAAIALEGTSSGVSTR